MLVPELLLKFLEDLLEADFGKFKWYLTMSVLGGCERFPQSSLEGANRMDTVKKMIDRYGEASAVKVAVEILKKMHNNDAADRLEKECAAATSSSSSTSTASSPPTGPATISAQGGSVVIAPVVNSGTTASLNINITKS